MLKQLVLMESQRLVPKSMCEDYRKRAVSAKPAKRRVSLRNGAQQQQIIQ